MPSPLNRKAIYRPFFIYQMSQYKFDIFFNSSVDVIGDAKRECLQLHGRNIIAKRVPKAKIQNMVKPQKT